MTFITAILSVPRRCHALAAVLLGALLAMPGQAQTTQRIPVTEIKPLLALAAERGAAHGVLTGPGAVAGLTHEDVRYPTAGDGAPNETESAPLVPLRVKKARLWSDDLAEAAREAS